MQVITSKDNELVKNIKKLKEKKHRDENNQFIIEGIKLVAEEDTLTLCATDLDLSIEKKIKADVKVEGETVVPGKLFSEFIKKP